MHLPRRLDTSWPHPPGKPANRELRVPLHRSTAGARISARYGCHDCHRLYQSHRLRRCGRRPRAFLAAMGYATATTVRRAKGDVPKNLILGIDAGLTRTKAALFDAAGREVAAEGVSNEISRPFRGTAERSMDKAWMDAAKAIRGVLAAASATGADVAAVGVTGAMVGVWPVNDDGRPVRPAVLVADTRGQEAIDRAKTSDPSAMDRIFRSDGCVVEPGCTLPALRWLFDHEPEAYGARPVRPHLQGLAPLSSHRGTGVGRHGSRGRPRRRARAGSFPRDAPTLRARKPARTSFRRSDRPNRLAAS